MDCASSKGGAQVLVPVSQGADEVARVAETQAYAAALQRPAVASLCVALVEDDPSQTDLFDHWLSTAGHLCMRHQRGDSLLRALGRESFDAVIRDWTLPDIGGLDTLRHVRGPLQSSIPILVLSAHAREANVVTALNEGADDYMVKPVRRRELLARLGAVARRKGGRPQADTIDLGTLRIDCRTHTAWRVGRPIHLGPRDFHLSVLFLLNVGRLFSRGDLLETVWGSGAEVSSRMLDTYVCRIRDKLGLMPFIGWRLAAVDGHAVEMSPFERFPL